jgi:hypothetical protein
VSLVSYWVSTALGDWASYLLPASLALLLFALFGVDEFIGPASLLPTALLLFAYGPAVGALTYCFTFGFTHHATAQNAILLLHLFSGLLLSLASFIMSLIKNTRRTNHSLKVRTALGSAWNVLGLCFNVLCFACYVQYPPAWYQGTQVPWSQLQGLSVYRTISSDSPQLSPRKRQRSCDAGRCNAEAGVMHVF